MKATTGFLDKLRRIVRTSGLLGPRVRPTSNAYVLRFQKGLGGLAVNVFGLAPRGKSVLRARCLRSNHTGSGRGATAARDPARVRCRQGRLGFSSNER